MTYEAAYEAILPLLEERYPTRRPVENKSHASTIATLIEEGVLTLNEAS